MARQPQVPGATKQVEQVADQVEQTTAQKADEALKQITASDNPNTEPTQEELLREELALAQAQIAELKKSTLNAQGSSSVSIGEVKPTKRVPVLTEKGWTTKEAG